MQTDKPTTNVFSGAALWASAFVIGALIITQLGRPGGNAARAGLVSEVGDYTVLSFDGGTDDYVAVLDQRSEDLFIYHVKNRNTFDFVSRASLARIFQEGQRVGAGGQRK